MALTYESKISVFFPSVTENTMLVYASTKDSLSL